MWSTFFQVAQGILNAIIIALGGHLQTSTDIGASPAGYGSNGYGYGYGSSYSVPGNVSADKVNVNVGSGHGTRNTQPSTTAGAVGNHDYENYEADSTTLSPDDNAGNSGASVSSNFDQNSDVGNNGNSDSGTKASPQVLPDKNAFIATQIGQILDSLGVTQSIQDSSSSGNLDLSAVLAALLTLQSSQKSGSLTDAAKINNGDTTSSSPGDLGTDVNQASNYPDAASGSDSNQDSSSSQPDSNSDANQATDSLQNAQDGSDTSMSSPVIPSLPLSTVAPTVVSRWSGRRLSTFAQVYVTRPTGLPLRTTSTESAGNANLEVSPTSAPTQFAGRPATTTPFSRIKNAYTGGIPVFTTLSSYGVTAPVMVPTCGIPNSLVGQPIQQLSKMLGGWYEYMYRTPGLVTVYNVFTSYTGLGYTVIRETSSWGLATTFNTYMSIGSQADGSLQCVGIFQQANLTTDGRKFALAYFPGNQNPGKLIYTTIFTDYVNMEVMYRCNKPNLNTGICDEPFLWVDTREHPVLMNLTMQTYIQNTVNTVLQKYGFGTQQLSMSNWIAIPSCLPQPPPAFTESVQSVVSNSAFRLSHSQRLEPVK